MKSIFQFHADAVRLPIVSRTRCRSSRFILLVLRDLGADFNQVFQGMSVWERLAARVIDLPEEVETPHAH